MAEVALIGLSLATVAGLYRLFDHGSFLPQLAFIVVVAHVVSIAARRLGWGVTGTAFASLAAMVVTIGIALYGGTTAAGIPTPSTVHAVRTDLHDVWHLFQSVQAPTPALRPFLLIAALGLWWAAFVADWAAFRLWVPFEAVLPAGTVFVFSSLFASQRGQIAASALFLVGAFAFLLVHRVTRQQSSAGWVSSDVQRGTNSLLRAGAGLAVLAVVAAVIIGPNLPQAHSQALVGWRGGEGDGPSSRTTVSPFVEIKKRLVDQSNLELFTVTSNQRSYWRMTSLDQFDGNVWSSNGSYEKASGSLPQRVPADVSTVVSQQSFAISALDTIWLPAAFEPRSINAGNTAVRYETDSSTLIVGTSLPNSNGSSYTVQSALPVFDPARLAASDGPPPSSLLQQETQLPDSLDPSVKQLAQQVTAGNTTPYTKALALQDYFRNNFTYDLSVAPGESNNAILDFLNSKRGYCEQFAGTFAAMARSVGLPTRVAVGFTPGEQDPVHPNEYHVKGLHAHAWPEVFIEGQGWVLFEPTPTRGAPNAEQYTHVPEEQATAGGSATTISPTTAAPTATTNAPTPTTSAANAAGNDDSASTGPRPSFWSTKRFGGRALVALLILFVLAIVYAIAIPIAYRTYRRRRRRAATEPDERVRLAWQESVEAAQVLGVSPLGYETHTEFGRRARRTIGTEGFPVLADLVTAADYSVDGVDDEGAATAVTLSDEVSEAVRAQSTRQQRLASALDPRPPDRRRPAAPRHHSGRSGTELPPIEVVRLPASSS
jgi:transglutaminase-like putative cysteine protease